MLNTIAQDQTHIKSVMGNTVKTYHTLNTAHNAAYNEARTLGSTAEVFPATMYSQGGRIQFNLVVPFEKLVELVKLNSASAKDKTNVGNFINRPIDNNHVRRIALYLENNSRYILPPFTLNTRTPISVHANNGTSSCYIVVPGNAELYVTDGQHRLEAVKRALKHKEELGSDGACVVIIQETEIDKIHQDFIDCSKTKPISRSLILAFSSTDNHVNFVKNFIECSVIFKDRVDLLNANVGNDTNMLLTLGGLDESLAELIYGPISRSQYANRNNDLMPTTIEEEGYIDLANDFWEEYAANNKYWHAFLNPTKTGRINTQMLRQRFIDFSPTGVRLISKIGHLILKHNIEKQKVLIKALAELDYQRTNPFWEGKLIISDGNERRPMVCNVPHMKLVVMYVARQLEKKTGIDLIE